MATNKHSTSTSETGKQYVITENNPWFGSNYTSYDTNQGGGYHFRKYPDGSFRMFHNKTGEYLPVTDDEQIEYLQNRANVLNQNSNNERVNLLGRMMPLKLLNTKFGNFIGHLEKGGTMNYALYLQNGDTILAPMTDEQALAHLKQVDNEMAEAIKADPQKLEQVMQEEDAPSFIKHMIDVAMENQDEDLLNILQPYAERLNIALSFKCGGKVRAKVKKARCGKKLEEGAKVPVAKKGCPCQYKKIGGYIKLVDCNGIPVAKNGTVLYAKDGEPAPFVKYSQNEKGSPVYSLNGRNYTAYSGTFSDENGTAPVQDMNALREAKKWYDETGGSAYKLMSGNVYSKLGSDRLYGKVDKDGKTFYYSNLGASDAKWNPETNLWEREGYTYTPYKMDNGQDSFKWVLNQPTELPEVTVTPSNNKLTWRLLFDAGKVKYGGLTKEEALARQREMQAAKGFNVDLGKWGADGMWGKQSKAEWERYQAWKQQQAQPTMSADEKFVRELETSGRPVQDAEYANMDASQAIHLKDPIAYLRWLDLNFNKVQAAPYVTPVLPAVSPTAVPVLPAVNPTTVSPTIATNPGNNNLGDGTTRIESSQKGLNVAPAKAAPLSQNLRQYLINQTRWNDNAKSSVGQALNRMSIARQGKSAIPAIKKFGGQLTYAEYLK